jgi:hypothetical protein
MFIKAISSSVDMLLNCILWFQSSAVMGIMQILRCGGNKVGHSVIMLALNFHAS